MASQSLRNWTKWDAWKTSFVRDLKNASFCRERLTRYKFRLSLSNGYIMNSGRVRQVYAEEGDYYLSCCFEDVGLLNEQVFITLKEAIDFVEESLIIARIRDF